MKTYRFKFRGRQAGAIGIFYEIFETYRCESLSEAKSLLYEDYEHIGQLTVYENAKQLPLEDFNDAEFIPVRSNKERRRDAKGGYLYTRSDSPVNK